MQFLKNIDSLRAKKDILIFKKFVKNHNIVLRKVLAVLDESGMTRLQTNINSCVTKVNILDIC